MKKFMSCVLGVLMIVSVAAEARSSYSSSSSSSRSSSYSSSSRSSFSAPKSTPAPSRSSGSSYSAPKATTSSNPGLKSLGFGRPASSPMASKPSVSVSPKTVYNSNVTPKTTTTSGGWFSKKTVSSAPAYKAPQRKVMSPTAYRSQPRNVTVIQRNYYGGNSYGYNRGYGGGYYNSYHPYGYSSGFGSSFAGTLGGLMVFSALTNSHHSNGNASAAQIEQAKQDQRIEDKLDRVLDQQNQPVGVTPVVMAQAAPQPVVQPQCFLPEDAPLMMSPSFYCTPAK